MATFTPADIRIAVDERVLPGTSEYAQDKIGNLLRLAHRPVLSARVRVTRHGDPAVPRPVVAQANIDVNGRLVRAQAEGENAREAVDRLEERLRHRLERIAQHWEARRGGQPSAEPHEWRHESEPAHRPHWYPRLEGEREIVRHKSYTPVHCTIDDAARDMGLLDYDFHLFTESGTGRDSVLYRAGDTGYRLAQLTPPGAHELAPFQLPVTISEQPAPLLSTDEAVTRLGLLDLPFLFFLDSDRGRGAVLYHRYDGHYGLITPGPEEP
ncbi:ribosome hibernation promotion factor [Amycolatopsis benzoatilytica]|uniref:ribosome hibernation promotion factor n=1 Tax=Amycolatopsis benzoatilytica TaxID=346045 RepID=UPI00035E3C41|nr:HPF/RaiA family ribosome-associated protein [Amycolatopsis benzoatilytica]